MKKVLTYVIIFLSFIFIYILQSSFFTWFTIMGVQPNLFAILILFCGLFTGKMSGLINGVIFGIFIDLFIQTDVIIEPIVLGTLGFATAVLSKNFSKENRFNIMIMVIITTFVYEIGVYMLRMLIYSVQFEFFAFIKIILIEILFNAMITIIIYPLFQFLGRKVENRLVGDKISRYF